MYALQSFQLQKFLILYRSWLNQVGVHVVGSLGSGYACDHSEHFDEQVVGTCDKFDWGTEAQFQQEEVYQTADAHSSFPIATALPPPAFPLWCVSWTPSLLDLASCSFNHPFVLPVTFLLDVTACIALVSAVTADDHVLRLPPSSFSIEFNRWQQADERRIVAEGGRRRVAAMHSFNDEAVSLHVHKSFHHFHLSSVTPCMQHPLTDFGAPFQRRSRDCLLYGLACFQCDC